MNSKCHLTVNVTVILSFLARVADLMLAKMPKCKMPNDYKYFQGSNDPWFCAICCSAIFLFASLNNSCFLLAISI